MDICDGQTFLDLIINQIEVRHLCLTYQLWYSHYHLFLGPVAKYFLQAVRFVHIPHVTYATHIVHQYILSCHWLVF